MENAKEKSKAPEGAERRELSDEQLDAVAGGGSPSAQELEWKAQAAADGRNLKVVIDRAEDRCSNHNCHKVGSTYAKSQREEEIFGHFGKTSSIMVQFMDCKCYACHLETKAIDKGWKYI